MLLHREDLRSDAYMRAFNVPHTSSANEAPELVDVNAPLARIPTTAKGDAAMDENEDLSSLENDADEFDRILIQNARDERRLLNGTRRVTAFSKARPGSARHVGARLDGLERLTLDNLERNDARNEVKFESPPSSNGSARSDPAIHAPATWGRKSRANRNWMRSITYEEQVQVQTPPQVEVTPNGLYDYDANLPRHSVEDSPLSHKSTPRHDRLGESDWDLTFELNEASMIASTPYIPRNTALDDIRQREIESVEIENVKTGRLRQGSPEETRRPRTSVTANGANNVQQTIGPPSPEKKWNRSNAWQSIGKSQPVTGTGKENTPAQNGPVRPLRHRREDSQDLLRRLARASNTPSPGRVIAPPPRSQTTPAKQPDAVEAKQIDTPPDTPDKTRPAAEDAMPAPSDEVVEPAPERQPEHPEQHEQAEVDTAKQGLDCSQEAAKPAEAAAEDVDATPMPVERSVLAPKTPIVTGAWVDTPGPRTARKQLSITRTPPRSPQKNSPQKKSPQKRSSPEKQAPQAVEEAPAETIAEVTRPQVHTSALQALVQEAKAHGRRESAEYGDSTINSLEGLMDSPTGRAEEDTLQDLPLPTVTPRNEAERQRQEELLHLHRMNDRLRAARTSIRDASRGMRRVEDRVEHGEGVDTSKTTVLTCPCAAEGHTSRWKYPVKMFWDPRLKTKRKGSQKRMLGGLTALSLVLLGLLIWWISEEIACEFYCHHPYASYSPYKFSVNPNAPQYPFVLPTLFYRTFVRAWWKPSSHATGWMWRNTVGDASPSATAAAWASSQTVVEEAVWEQSMLHDEVLR